MKYFIIVIIIAVLFFVFKKKIKTSLISLKNRKIEIKNVNSELVYAPVTSSRTFDFSIEIVELGGGKVTLNVLKKDNKKTLDL